ncbi:tetratricopeptide repeat protein [Spirosoma validum]|uniref:Tetratricopeptide repeat protein n=1 Tax=Spirosoma validum TaxID=2771355 RepID=A0A927AY46_9BACT|nr:tetratricopeptide repeat protein [Spirosoma validum]MBD2751893.1 tetratricopeptide repeat protein [Spirosoma validum]
MKRLCYLYLFPISVMAQQNGERLLNAFASELAGNRSAQKQFFFAERREKARMDTLSATADNYRYRALNYLWRRDYEQAVVWLEKTCALYPKEHGFVGELYLSELHDYPRALAHFDAYDALTPAFNDMISNSPVSYLRGLTYRSLGNHAKALEQFSTGIDSLVAKHGTEWVNYRHYVSRAVSYMAMQQPDKALLDLDHAAKNFNRSALVHYQRGRALLQLNRTSEAQTAFQDASFFYKAFRAQRTGDYQEDVFNPIYEPEIDSALANLKTQSR